MTGFRCPDCGLARFKIAHLADQNDVRILTQRTAQRIRKRRDIHTDFTLVNNAGRMFKAVFNRIFNRNDMCFAFMRNRIDHCGHRR